MAYRLVRESSETPNITNRDDVKMVRYAYGNYDGVVKGFGEEMSITVDGSTATVHSGRMVLNGWEVDVDPNGVSFNALPGNTQYCCIVLTVNLSNESAKFSLVSNSGVYPDVPVGDDLSQYPNGSRRIITHKLYSENGVFFSCERVVPLIPYLFDLEKRVEELGFKKGLIEVYFYNDSTNKESKVELLPSDPYEPYSLIKQGKMSLLNLNLFALTGMTYSPPEGLNPTHIRVYLPEGFKPKNSLEYCYAEISPLLGEAYFQKISIEISETHRVYMDLPYTYFGAYTIYNFGWELE